MAEIRSIANGLDCHKRARMRPAIRRYTQRKSSHAIRYATPRTFTAKYGRRKGGYMLRRIAKSMPKTTYHYGRPCPKRQYTQSRRAQGALYCVKCGSNIPMAIRAPNRE